MQGFKQKFWLKIFILFGVGLLGVLSVLPIIPNLIAASGQVPPMPMAVIQAVSFLQSATFLFLLIWLGAWLAPKVNLSSPWLDAWLAKSLPGFDSKKILIPGVLGGVLGGVLITLFFNISVAYLPKEFIANGESFNPPVYTKILYGGITEELLIRWGVMSFLVWASYRITSKSGQVRAYHYLTGIILSALLFGFGHLPAASMLSTELTSYLVFYIIVGNSIFGVIAGLLFWRRGLEAAILAHMLAHVVMIGLG